MRTSVVSSLILLAGLLTLAATAQANFVVSAEDPAGDAGDGNPARDIVRIAFQYDRSGALRGGTLLAGTPAAASAANLTLFAGTKAADGSCTGYPAVGFGTATNLTGVDWVRLDAPGAEPAAVGRATKTYEGPAEDYEAFDDALAGRRPNCVVAQLNDIENPALVYDVAGPYPLLGLPELTTEFDTPIIKRGAKPRKMKVVLRNDGDAPTGKLRLRIKSKGGVKSSGPRTVKSIGAEKRRVIRVKLSAGRKAEGGFLTITATGVGGIKASDTGYVNVYTGSGGGGGGGGGGGNDDGVKLCYRYTWLPPYSELRPC